MYDDSSSFEERKQLLDAVKESEQFAGIADTGKQSQFTSRSQSRQDGILSRKKPFRLLDSEDSDPDDFEMKGEKTIPSPKLVSSLEKPNNTNVSPSPNVKEHVKLSTDSYAGKVLAASLKKNTTSGKLRSPTLLLQRIDKPKFCNAEKVEELLLHSDSSSESPIFVSSIESRSPKLVAVEVSNPSQKSNTNQIKKSKLVAMKSTAKKYSKLLNNIQKMKPTPLPETFDFITKDSYQMLLARENARRETQLANNTAVKLCKSINLSSLNGKKRHNLKALAISNTSPLRINNEIDLFDQQDPIFDSPSISHKQQMTTIITSLESPMQRSSSVEPMVNSEEEFESDSNPKYIPKSLGELEAVDSSECPICNKPFPTNMIEVRKVDKVCKLRLISCSLNIQSHAAECYNYLGDEELKDDRPRSTRSRLK